MTDPAPDETAPAESETSGEAAAPAESAPPELGEGEVRAAVEACLFASAEPVSAAALGRALSVDARAVARTLRELATEYAGASRGFELVEVAGGYQLTSREVFASYVERMGRQQGARRLSAAALETLALVAYRQPVQRAEIERVRGVSCGELLRSLLERGLVRIVGRAQEPGHPLLYGTTKGFLEHFGLKSIGELPRPRELKTKPGGAFDRPPAPPEENAKNEEGETGDEIESSEVPPPEGTEPASEEPEGADG